MVQHVVGNVGFLQVLVDTPTFSSILVRILRSFVFSLEFDSFKAF